MASSNLEIKLRITSDQAEAVKGLIDTKAKVGELTGSLSIAEEESARLQAEFEAAAKTTDSLGIQIALAKGELKRLAEQGISPSHAEYRALAGEIENMEAALKRSLGSTQSAEKAYNDSAKQVARFEAQLTTNQAALTKQEVALKAAGVDTGNLASEYTRLKAAAESATSLNTARGVLDVKPHQAVEAEIQRVKQAFQTLKDSGTLSQKEIAQAAVKAEEKIRALKQSTEGWTESLAKARGAFVQAGVAAGGLTAAAQQAIQFESAMADVAKTTGLSDTQLGNLSTRLKELSTEIPISADGLAQIAAAGGQLGIANDQIEQFVRLAATISTAFDIPVEQAGEAVASLTNNFGLSIAEVGRLADTINVLGNNTAAREKDIVDALGRIGGVAKQFGLSADQAAALADAMLALKIPAEQASTAINAMLGKLQTARIGSKDFQEGLAQLGISADQLAADIQANPSQALTRFLHQLEQLDAQSRAEILSRLFGQEHADEIARLVGALGNYDKAMQLAGNSAANAGAAQREFETRLQTTEAQLQLMKNAVEVAAVNLGTVFLPIVKDVAEGIRDGAKAIADFEAAFPGITGLAASLATTAAAIGAVRVALVALAVPAAAAGASLKAMAAAGNLPLLEAVSTVGKLRAALTGLSAFLIGWDLGSWARTEFEGVYQAGVALAAGLTRSAESVRYAWELAQAVFTSDTIEAATARHEQRLREIDDTYSDLFGNWKSQTDQQGAKTDELTGKQENLGKAGAAAGQQLAEGQTAAAEATGEHTRQLAAAVTGLDQLSKTVESHTQELEKEYQQRKTLLEQQLANAKAEGNEAETVRILGELKKAEVTQAAALVQAKQQEANVAEALVTAKEEEALAVGGVTAEEQAGIDTARIAAIATRDSANAAQTHYDALSRLPAVLGQVRTEQALTNQQILEFKQAAAGAIQYAHEQRAAFLDGKISIAELGEAQADATAKLETYNQALRMQAEQLKNNEAAISREASLDRQRVQNKIAVVQAAQNAAKASGDETRATQLGTEVKRLEAQQEAISAAEKAKLADAAAQLAANLEAQAQADGVLTTAEQAAIQAAKDNAEAKKLEAEQSRIAASTKLAEADATAKEANAKKSSKQATDEAKTSLDKLNQSQSDSVQILTAGEKALAAYTQAVNVYGNLDLGLKLANDSLQQKASLESLKASLDAAAVSGQGLGDAMRDAGLSSDLSGVSIDDLRRRFNLLDDADLSNLLSSVNSVRSAVQSLRESTASTLSSLQDELDSLTGNERAKTEREYQTKKAELDAAYQEAVNARDAQSQSNALEAIKLLKEIHEQKMAAFREEEAAAQEAERQDQPETTRRQTQQIQRREAAPASTPVPSPGDTIRLELAPIGSSRIIPATVDRRFKDDLLDLKRSKQAQA